MNGECPHMFLGRIRSSRGWRRHCPSCRRPLRGQNRPRRGRRDRDVARVRRAPRCIGTPPAWRPPWGGNGLTLPYRVCLRSRVNLEKMPMNLTIKLPDEDVAALKAKATAQGITAEQYALQVLEQDLAPNGFANRGQPPRKPDCTSFPPMRSTRRLRQREKPGAKPARTPAHDPRWTGNTKHFPATWRETRIVAARNFLEIIASEPEQQRR